MDTKPLEVQDQASELKYTAVNPDGYIFPNDGKTILFFKLSPEDELGKMFVMGPFPISMNDKDGNFTFIETERTAFSLDDYKAVAALRVLYGR